MIKNTDHKSLKSLSHEFYSSSLSQITAKDLDLIGLSTEEWEKLYNVLEKDSQIKKNEETRLKYIKFKKKN
jgi:hypothetical protein